jgi:hypothetical protein
MSRNNDFGEGFEEDDRQHLNHGAGGVRNRSGLGGGESEGEMAALARRERDIDRAG